MLAAVLLRELGRAAAHRYLPAPVEPGRKWGEAAKHPDPGDGTIPATVRKALYDAYLFLAGRGAFLKLDIPMRKDRRSGDPMSHRPIPFGAHESIAVGFGRHLSTGAPSRR